MAIRAILTQHPTTEETISVEIQDENPEVVEAGIDRFMAQCDRIRIAYNEKIFLVHEKKLREINDLIETDGEKLRQIRREIETAKAELATKKGRLKSA